MSRRHRRADTVERAVTAFSGHRLAPSVAKSWTMRDPAKGRTYSFTVTWSPGTLCLSGDIGEMVIRHGELRDLWTGILWLHGSDFDYIMGKSDQRPKYDEDATCAEFIRVCNEDAIDEMNARLDRHREYRHDKAKAKEEFEKAVGEWSRMVSTDYDGDNTAAIDDGHQAPTLDDFEDRFVADPEHYDLGPLKIDFLYGGRPARRVPDGWEWWDKLREALPHCYIDENDIFTAAGRRRIKKDLRDELANGGHRAHKIASEMGLDDFGAVTDWTWHHRFQFEALQLWCRTMRAEEPRWHRAWRALKRARAWVKRLPDRWDSTHIRPDLWWREDTSSKRIVAEDGSVSWVSAPNGRIDKHSIWIKKPHHKKDGSIWHQLVKVKPFLWRGRVVHGVWTEAGSYWGPADNHTLHPVPAEHITTITTKA